MTTRGLGDRWLAGESIDGVRFAHHARVSILGGSRDGASGTIALLLAVRPEPLYLVSLDDGFDLRVRQSALLAAD